uniref:Uncharacterized protein n=1 Tax=Triticum urartu TaxID=4572 RepID=A0A8R7TKI4_TRIUA
MGGGRGWGFRENLQGSFSRLAFRAARGRGREREEERGWRGGGRARGGLPACLLWGWGRPGRSPFLLPGRAAPRSPSGLLRSGGGFPFSWVRAARAGGGSLFPGNIFFPGFLFPCAAVTAAAVRISRRLDSLLGGRRARATVSVRPWVGWMPRRFGEGIYRLLYCGRSGSFKLIDFLLELDLFRSYSCMTEQ